MKYRLRLFNRLPTPCTRKPIKNIKFYTFNYGLLFITSSHLGGIFFKTFNDLFWITTNIYTKKSRVHRPNFRMLNVKYKK